MAASAAPGDADHSVQYGLQGSIEAVEPGYSLSYIIALAPEGGVNMAFEAWGDKLLATCTPPPLSLSLLSVPPNVAASTGRVEPRCTLPVCTTHIGLQPRPTVAQLAM